MATALIQHIYECDEATFFRDILLSADFNRQLFIEHLKFKQWEIDKLEETDAEMRREVLVRPVTGELPAVLAKLVGDNLGFREVGVFDKQSRRYRLRIVPNRLADKLTITGTIYVEPRGEHRCERFVELDVSAKIFGVGSMVEKRIIDDTRASYDQSHGFARDYLARVTSP